LSATQSDGQPWPTFSEELAQACTGTSAAGPEQTLRGMCADGKQFISSGGPFGGSTLYFRGESMVGIVNTTDVVSGRCECPLESFRGTLETVRCDAPTFEALCGSPRPMTFEAPFAQGTAACQCDDPS
jgi:hypothetical protein